MYAKYRKVLSSLEEWLPEKPARISQFGACAWQYLRHIKDVHLMFLYL
tara:strand:+ start:6428 stop:6571 length:144 start_codon:yes stop_codon:yes gene_type:complete